MRGLPRKMDLSDSCRWLLEQMQRVDYGQIVVVINGGEPVMAPPPKVTRTIKLDEQPGTRSEINLSDFVLQNEVIRLFEKFSKLDDETVVTVKVQNGLPTFISFEETIRQ